MPCLSNCCDNGCGCGHGGILGGVGIYWVQPFFNNNPAYFTHTTTTTPGHTFSSASQVDLSHDMEVFPELWLGYISDSGLGFRTRIWWFREGSGQDLSLPAANGGQVVSVNSAGPLGVDTVDVSNAAGPATFSVTSKLDVHVWDLEAIQNLQVCHWDLLLCGGLRFVHLNERYDAYGTETEVTTTTVGAYSVNSGHSFTGIGPELALEARRPLGSSVALYGCARGALVFGSSKQDAFSVQNGIQVGSFSEEAFDHHDKVLPIAELEIGVEASRRVGNARLFGQLALVGQGWFGAGNASRTSNPDVLGGLDGGTVEDGDFGFFGLAFRVGVNY